MMNHRQAIASNVFFIPAFTDADFSWLSQYTNIAVICDEHTKEHCYPTINAFLPKHHCIQITSGEENKNLSTCSQIWQGLTNEGFDRKSLVINLGGGVIGDMGGFCAASYKRGVDFIQIPTTLLAQVDASVGGKLGIDFNGFKNHIGFFTQPNMVFIHPPFLETLPFEELRSGYAEVLKHSLIADEQHWRFITQPNDFSSLLWEEVIPHSIKIKAKVVTQDPKEAGLRKILNFGHTVGHAAETYFLGLSQKKLLHGEAVALGMVAEAFLSTKITGLPQKSLQQITDYLVQLYGKVKLSDKDIELIIPNALQDKKNIGSSIRAALLKNIGDAVFDIAVSESDIHESLVFYQNLS